PPAPPSRLRPQRPRRPPRRGRRQLLPPRDRREVAGKQQQGAAAGLIDGGLGQADSRPHGLRPWRPLVRTRRRRCGRRRRPVLVRPSVASNGGASAAVQPSFVRARREPPTARPMRWPFSTDANRPETPPPGPHPPPAAPAH